MVCVKEADWGMMALMACILPVGYQDSTTGGGGPCMRPPPPSKAVDCCVSALCEVLYEDHVLRRAPTLFCTMQTRCVDKIRLIADEISVGVYK